MWIRKQSACPISKNKIGGFYEVVAINDLASPAMLAHLLKYDSTQGAYAKPFGAHTVEAGEDNIVVDGKKITIYAKANAAELPGGMTQVQVVSWYDNENSYVSQMVRTIKHFSTLL